MYVGVHMPLHSKPPSFLKRLRTTIKTTLNYFSEGVVYLVLKVKGGKLVGVFELRMFFKF